MKNRLITGILFIVLGALIAIGPQVLFPVCALPAAQPAMSSGMGQDPAQSSSGMTDTNGMQMGASAAAGSGDECAMSTSTGMIMKCHWTAQAELGVGTVIALLGALLIIIKSGQTRFGISLALVLNGILALLIPTVLIGVCGDAEAACRLIALPALIIISGGTIAAAIVNIIYLLKKKTKEYDRI